MSNPNTVIFSHGKESGPNGNKITELSKIATNLGCKTISVDYRNCNDEFERRVLLQETIEQALPTRITLVGSSMGGYISTVMAEQYNLDGLFLMNPAFYLPDYEKQEFFPKTSNIEIIAGWNDDIVLYGNSIKFGDKHKSKIHLLNDGHRLQNSIEDIKSIFEMFLKL